MLNNKRGIVPDSKEAIDEVNKVNVNLSKIGDKNSIDKIEEKVSLCMVNAKTALKGKLENKQLMLKGSNIFSLEKMISKELSQSGSIEVANTLNSYINDFIELVVTKLDSQVDNLQVKEIEELITSIEKLQRSSEIKLKDIISKRTTRLENEARQELLGAPSEGALNLLINNSVEDIYKQSESIFNDIENELRNKLDEFSVEFEKLSVGVDLPLSEGKSDEGLEVSPELKGKMKELASNKQVVEGISKQALTYAKEYLPKAVMRGKGPAWISKAAGKAAVVVNVAVAAFEIYSATKEHNEMIAKERGRVLSAENTSKSIADDIQVTMRENINKALANTFNDLLVKYRDVSKKLNSDNTSLNDSKEKLQSICSRLMINHD